MLSLWQHGGSLLASVGIQKPAGATKSSENTRESRWLQCHKHGHLLYVHPIRRLICSPNKTVSTDPVFRIQNNLIVRKPKAKYLGHIISEDMSDDADVFRQVKCLYIRGNIISRKFANCSINVKLVVFKTYCSCLYTSQLWGTCLSRTMNRLKVAYNDSLRMVLGIPRYCSASEMFAYTNVPSCQCVIRLNIYSFMKRIQCMNNEIVHSIVHSDLIFSSLLWLNWRRRLFFASNS